MVLVTSSAAVFECYSAAEFYNECHGKQNGRFCNTKGTGNVGNSPRAKKAAAASDKKNGIGPSASKTSTDKATPTKKGSGGSSGAGETKKSPPAKLYKGLSKKESKTVDEAIDHVKSGKAVKLKTKEEAYTLVQELGKKIKDGTAPEKMNLCTVSVPGTNLYCGASKDIPRTLMPQLSGTPIAGSPADKWPKNSEGKVDGTQEFLKFMEKSGVKVTEQKVKASQLKASQMELDTKKVHGMVNSKDFDPAGEPIFVSKDGFVIDGHHRWAAQITRDLQDGRTGDLPLNVRVVDLTIDEALQMANEFSKQAGLPQAGM